MRYQNLLEHNQEAITKILSDQRLYRDLKIGANARIWRGENGGGGFATYGLGLYSTTNKNLAREYGDVVELDRWSSLPDSPFRFDTVNDFQIWYGNAIKILGMDKRDIAKQYHDFSDFIKSIDSNADGIQIGKGNDAIFVQYEV